MKRINNVFNKICSYENLYNAHAKARLGKTHYAEVQKVDNNYYDYLKNLEFLLINEIYYVNSADYKKKIINDKGKERLIMKLKYYPHRIVQWAIILQIKDKLFSNLTKDTYSAIEGRGLHLCKKNLRKALTDKDNTQYCLKLDIKKYYPSIDKDILINIYSRLIKDKRLLRLLKIIIYSDGEPKGQPIGSLLSQWSGNLYLSSLDHYIKEELKIKYYFRYCDDIVILGNDKDFLRDCFYKIQEFIDKNLKLKIKDNYQIFPVDIRGIDFLGYRFFRKYTLLRKKILKRMKKSISKMKGKTILTYSEFCSLNSYLGWLKHCDGFKLYQKYIMIFNGLYYYDLDNNKRRIFLCWK